MNAPDTSNIPHADFGRRLVKLRKAARFNRTQFAKACKTGISTMQNYESGLRMPQGDVLYRMAEVLRTTVDNLLDPLADRLEEDGKESEGATSQRLLARMSRSLKEVKLILSTDPLSPIDQQRYILAMQHILLDALEDDYARLYGGGQLVHPQSEDS